MYAHARRLSLSLDPLIAEAKRRMRRRRMLVAGLLVVVVGAGGVAGAAFALRGPNAPYRIDGSSRPAVRTPAQQIGSGPFVLNGGSVGGGGSGLWGDGASGPHGATLGCIDRRHYSEAFGLQNRSHAAVTLVGAQGANPAPIVIERVAVQLRLAPPQRPTTTTNWGGDGDLVYRGWSAAPTRPVTIPPGRIATVQSNFLMHDCQSLARRRPVVVPGSLVLTYRQAGRVRRKTISLPSERLTLVPGPTAQRCAPVAGSVSLVAADTGCTAARQAALACHPMSHNSWGDCTSGAVLWDCGATAGPGSPYLETCWRPTKKSHWIKVRWDPPTFSDRAIGGVPLGLAWRPTVSRLSELLGTRSQKPPRNAACGPGFREVAWQHLYVEFKDGRLTGFRYIESGWPPSRFGEQRAAAAVPPLVTSRGITLGSTLGQARVAYGRLKAVGTDRWQTPGGLVLYDDARHSPDPPSSRIVEIKYGTCGDF